MLGFINVYKPVGMTSNAIVQRIKKRFHIKKIGHMGTLDPMACGVLPIAIGKATRLFDYSLDKTKRYTAIFDFGYTTDTLDTTGIETNRHDINIDDNSLRSMCNELLGENDQVPPNFSAKNINGKRAYDLAREGISFELKPKTITIYKLELIEKIDRNRYKFDIICSSGTYIRAIARDLAVKLNTYGCMSYLERTESGVFNLDNASFLDTILENENLNQFIISPLDVFQNFEKCEISKNEFEDLNNGKQVLHEPFNRETFIIFQNKIVGVAKSNLNYIKLSTYLYE